MAKQKFGLIVVIAVVIAAFFLYKGDLGFQAITGGETMTRTVPLRVDEGSSFSSVFTAINVPVGKWGASIKDNAVGGCLFPSGTAAYQSVMLSEDGNTKTVTITAPSTRKAQCVFNGDYMFGNFSLKNFAQSTVLICTVSSETCNDFDDDCDDLVDESLTKIEGCVQRGICAGAIKTCSVGIWSDCSKLPQTEVCDNVFDDNCDGVVTISNSGADAPAYGGNCDSFVSRDELGAFITKWIAGSVSREALGNSIMVWIESP